MSWTRQLLGWLRKRRRRANYRAWAQAVAPVGPGHTTDPTDSRLGHGIDAEPVAQHETYLVLSEEERAKGFIRPVRRAYVHATELGGCGTETTMSQTIAETYARDPHFYGATYCVQCGKHLPVGEHGEFVWDDGSKVGT